MSPIYFKIKYPDDSDAQNIIRKLDLDLMVRDLSPKEMEYLQRENIEIQEVILHSHQCVVALPNGRMLIGLDSNESMSFNIHCRYKDQGCYFVFDGADGVGKTTWLKQFKTFLENTGYDVVLVREPGETSAGKILREKVLSSNLGPELNLDIFIADRILTQQQVIKPALNAGKVVISDRSLLSTIVYQGLPYGKEKEVIERHTIIPEFIMPTHGFICLLEFEECEKRLNSRTSINSNVDENNHFDHSKQKEKQKRHEYYNRANEWAPFSVSFLDFSNNVDVLNNEVLLQIQRLMKDNQTGYYPEPKIKRKQNVDPI